MNMIAENNDFLTMSSEQLYDGLVTLATSDPQAKNKLETLKESNRYILDYEFRTMVDFSYFLNEHIREAGKQDFTKSIIKCFDIIDRATKCQLWSLVANAWNSLGITYQSKLMLERALECYSHAIRIESQHGVYKISPLIYMNIVGIFMQVENFDKALYFTKVAEKIIEEHKEQIPRYWMRYVTVCLSHIRIRVITKQIDQDVLKMYYDKIMAVDPAELSYEIKTFLLSAKYYYGFLYFTKEEMDEIFEQIKSMLGVEYYVIYVQQSIELSKTYGRDYDAYARMLLEYSDHEEDFHAIVDLYTSEVLMEYFEKHGDEEKLEEARTKYIKNSNEYLNQLSSQQNEAIKTIEELLMTEEFKRNNEIENVEFKKIADEAIQTRRELAQAYKRIEVIAKLGRKITATTDLNEVVDLIYHIVKEHLSVDSFVILYTDDENKVLKSVSAYQKNELQPKFEVPLSEKHNILVQCYDSRCILQYNACMNIINQSIYECEYDEYPKCSCILIPLILAKKVIGVFSLQSEREGAYEGENFKFLKEIEPYLSIALNNGVKSRMMERESENRKKIQLELEEANEILAKISSMDGLTKISSRRDFEEKFKHMLHQAQKENQSVCTFMMDIDNFKMYNDNYGHFQGDEILKQVAGVFKEHLNSVNGLSARFGGEEFIGAALKLSKEEALQLAQKICQDIENLKIEHRVSPWNVVTVSVGVAIAEAADESMRSKLMRVADECLYSVKESGKNKAAIGRVLQADDGS